MIFKVELNSFKKGSIRQVEIPDEELVWDGTVESILQQVFLWGQNEVQPRELPSVSAGDIINCQGKRYLVKFVGFQEVPAGYLFPGFEKFPQSSLRALFRREKES